MGYWASIGDRRIASGAIAIPLYGAWTADVVMATDVLLPTQVTLIAGNLSLVGTVYRQAAFAGRTEARLVGGGGGWGQEVSARGYNSSGGVLKSTILSDAATDVGESAAIDDDGVAGNQYVRYADKASSVLSAIAGTTWWIDEQGVTRVSERPTATISSPFTLVNFDARTSVASIATEDPASWVPGASFTASTLPTQTIASVRHVFADDGTARLLVACGTAGGLNDRWIENLREVIRSEIAQAIAYTKVWEYTVLETGTDGSGNVTVSGIPADSTAPVPPLTGVPLRYGIAGASATPAEGTRVAIGFLNADPGQPVCLPVFDSTAPTSESITVAGNPGTLQLIASTSAQLFSGLVQLGDATATPIARAEWAVALAVALEAFATAVAGVSTGPGNPLAPLNAPATALSSALGALPLPATTKVLAT